MKTLTLAAAHKAITPVIRTVTNNPRANPRELKPSQVLQLLNSTPLGEVITDARLRRHRQRAALRIGDGKTIDVIRYAGWLVSELRRQESESPTTLSFSNAYDRKKERERERNAASSRSGRDIAPLPAVVNPDRRARAWDSLLWFATDYFPERFQLEFSEDHLELIKTLELTIIEGKLHAFALPRGSGKTTICEVAVIWAVLTGRRQFVALIGASQDAADELLQSIKTELESNDLLAEDFPEVCFPIIRLEGINNRAKGQLCGGLRTQIKWSGQTIVLPTVEGSSASGAIICVRGITGRVRGMKFTRPDGKTVRPDLAIIDDPQTDESARSPSQTHKRLKLVTGAILGLAGPGKKIAAAMPCTVIETDDLADQILDRKRHHEWNGKRCKLVYQWPEGEEAKKRWDEYSEIRRRDLATGGDGQSATDYYARFQAIMDDGAIVGWKVRHFESELSALQHAFNLRIDHPITFDAEYQNEPQKLSQVDLSIVPKASVLITKLSHVPRLVVPESCDRITAFIDIQLNVLYYMVTAWSPEFTGAVIDYGTEPDQRRHYFTLRDLNVKLRDKFPGANSDGAILEGLRSLASRLVGTTYTRQDGVPLRISRLLIDGGYKNHLAYQICREDEFSGVAMTSYGRGIGPDQKPIIAYEKKPGEEIGLNWMITRHNKRTSRHVIFDTHWWKVFLFDRFAVAPGDACSLSLFGSDPQAHHLLSEHLTAEIPDLKSSQNSGRTVTMFDQIPGRDNHWLDTLTGTAVAASMSGCVLRSIDLVQKPAKKKRTWDSSNMPIKRPKWR